jgi:hypothetical protein
MRVYVVRYCAKCGELTAHFRDQRPDVRWPWVLLCPLIVLGDLVTNRTACVTCRERWLLESGTVGGFQRHDRLRTPGGS